MDKSFLTPIQRRQSHEGVYDRLKKADALKALWFSRAFVSRSIDLRHSRLARLRLVSETHGKRW
jgi:hypothetical protein